MFGVGVGVCVSFIALISSTHQVRNVGWDIDQSHSLGGSYSYNLLTDIDHGGLIGLDVHVA